MIIADLLQISINLIFVATIVVCILLLGIVLMQRPKQEGLGAAFGAALTDQAFGARTTDVLQKGTVYLGSLFMILCFVFSLLLVYQHSSTKSTLGKEGAVPAVEAPAKSEESATDKEQTPASVEADPAKSTDATPDWIKTAEEAAKKQAEQTPAPAPVPAPEG